MSHGALATLMLMLAAAGCGDSAGALHFVPAPRPFALLSAFPAELAPHIARATIRETRIIDDRVFRVGELDGVPVVLALTGIGLVNAASTTDTLLDNFDVQGVIVSAVAGSNQLPIGDVAVPLAWEAADGTTYSANQQWIALAEQVAAPGAVSLERCTMVPSASGQPVCMPQQLSIVVGGVGQSTDPFHNQPFPCQLGGDDLYGCDVALTALPSQPSGARPTLATTAAVMPVVNDMETAAIAREVAAHGLPFIAFRAVSDGPGDPLALGNFLDQFAAYYHLAAQNAAAATAVFLKQLAATTAA